MLRFGNLVGLAFSVGILLSAGPAFDFLSQRKSITKRIKKFANDKDFSDQVITTFLVGSSAALITGIATRSSLITVFSLGAGGILGFKGANLRQKSQEMESDLRLRLASGSFIDTIGICTRSGLSIRKSVIEAADKNSFEIKQVWKPISDDVGAEYPFLKILENVAENNRSNVMGRIAITLQISQERGTPIQQTLQGLSSEIRSETRRQLLEIAAKKDVAMMIPVVFGILPSITAIALYPAFVSLTIM